MLPDNAENLLMQLRPFIRDEESFGRLHGDFSDIMKICEWFLQIMKKIEEKPLSRDELEALLIEIDVGLVDHASFHLRSMKKEIRAALEKLDEADDEILERHSPAKRVTAI